MESDISEIEKAWEREITPAVIKAATKDWDEYSPAVQAIIEAEARRRGLWEKVLYLRGENPEFVTSPEGNLEGYICKGCKGTYLNFKTGRCGRCDLPPEDFGYCKICDKFISIPPGQPCPKDGTKLDRHKAAMALLRLGNSIFDKILLLPLIFLVALVFIFLGIVTPESLENIDPSIDTGLSIAFLFLYYLIFEAIWQRTPGKFITGTKVVASDGTKPTLGNIATRTVVRFVPFEAFSFLGERVRGWHDKWSGTYVIQAKRFERKSVDQRAVSDLPKGIGGWLILPAIGLVLSPILIIKDVLDILPIYRPEIWNTLTNPVSEDYLPYFAQVVTFELLVNFVLFVYSMVLLFYFFGKRKALPKLIIIFLLLRLAFVLADYVATELVLPERPFTSERVGEIIGLLIRFLGSCLIWIPYFLKSKRVKNTFVIEARKYEERKFTGSEQIVTRPQPTSVHRPYDKPIENLAASYKKLQVCENCERVIGKLEQSYIFKDHIVCTKCYQVLNSENN